MMLLRLIHDCLNAKGLRVIHASDIAPGWRKLLKFQLNIKLKGWYGR